MFLVALLLAAAAPQKPWLEMEAGPMFLRDAGRSVLSRGPLVRLGLGYPLGDRAAAEVWLSGSMEGAPRGTSGDRALVSGGGGGRAMLFAFAEGKLGLWARGGVGWSLPAAGDGQGGPTGFAGALLSFQPFVKRFSLAFEVDGIAHRNSLGIAVLPSIKCSF
jgi:hypothetical protein